MLRSLLYMLFVHPLALLWFGTTVRGARHLPKNGPTLVVANHNSHLDTVVLLGAFDAKTRARVFSAAAADTFFQNRVVAFLTRLIFGAIPVERAGNAALDVRLARVVRRLRKGGIVILYPEGTRGDPDVAQRFRRGGLAHLCREVPDLTIVPVHIDGAARAMPKGAWIPLPFCIALDVGAPIPSPEPSVAWHRAQAAVEALAPVRVAGGEAIHAAS